MPLVLNILLGLAFAAAVAGAFHVWRRQMAAGRREDLQALAARRGWSLTISGEKLGRAGTLRLASRGGHPWTAEVRPATRATAAQTTAYDSEEPRWPEGTLVALAARVALPRAADGVAFDDLGPFLGDEVARLAAGLRPLPAAAALIALADADPGHRVDLANLGRVLEGWRPIVSGDRGAPILVLSPAGLRLRLRHPITRADHMERFLDLAFDLSRIIGP